MYLVLLRLGSYSIQAYSKSVSIHSVTACLSQHRAKVIVLTKNTEVMVLYILASTDVSISGSHEMLLQ